MRTSIHSLSRPRRKWLSACLWTVFIVAVAVWVVAPSSFLPTPPLRFAEAAPPTPAPPTPAPRTPTRSRTKETSNSLTDSHMFTVSKYSPTRSRTPSSSRPPTTSTTVTPPPTPTHSLSDSSSTSETITTPPTPSSSISLSGSLTTVTPPPTSSMSRSRSDSVSESPSSQPSDTLTPTESMLTYSEHVSHSTHSFSETREESKSTSPSDRNSMSDSLSETQSPTITSSPSRTPSLSREDSLSRSVSDSLSLTDSLSREESLSRSVSESLSVTESPSREESSSRSLSESSTLTDSPTFSDSLSAEPTLSSSVSGTNTVSASLTSEPTNSASVSMSVSPSASVSISASLTLSPSGSLSKTSSLTTSTSLSTSASLSVSESASEELSASRSTSFSLSDERSESKSYTITTSRSATLSNTWTLSPVWSFYIDIFGITVWNRTTGAFLHKQALPRFYHAHGVADFAVGNEPDVEIRALVYPRLEDGQDMAKGWYRHPQPARNMSFLDHTPMQVAYLEDLCTRSIPCNMSTTPSFDRSTPAELEVFFLNPNRRPNNTVGLAYDTVTDSLHVGPRRSPWWFGAAGAPLMEFLVSTVDPFGNPFFLDDRTVSFEAYFDGLPILRQPPLLNSHVVRGETPQVPVSGTPEFVTSGRLSPVELLQTYVPLYGGMQATWVPQFSEGYDEPFEIDRLVQTHNVTIVPIAEDVQETCRGGSTTLIEIVERLPAVPKLAGVHGEALVVEEEYDVVPSMGSRRDLSAESLMQNRRSRLVTLRTQLDAVTATTVSSFDFILAASPVEQRVKLLLCEWRGRSTDTANWTVITRMAIRISPLVVRCEQPRSFTENVDESILHQFYSTNFSKLDGGKHGGLDAWRLFNDGANERSGASYLRTNELVQRWWRAGPVPLDDLDLETPWLKPELDRTVDVTLSTWTWSTVNLLHAPRNRNGARALRHNLPFTRVPQTHVNQLDIVITPQRVVVTTTPEGVHAKRVSTLANNASSEYVSLPLPANMVPPQRVEAFFRGRPSTVGDDGANLGSYGMGCHFLTVVDKLGSELFNKDPDTPAEAKNAFLFESTQYAFELSFDVTNENACGGLATGLSMRGNLQIGGEYYFHYANNKPLQFHPFESSVASATAGGGEMVGCGSLNMQQFTSVPLCAQNVTYLPSRGWLVCGIALDVVLIQAEAITRPENLPLIDLLPNATTAGLPSYKILNHYLRSVEHFSMQVTLMAQITGTAFGTGAFTLTRSLTFEVRKDDQASGRCNRLYFFSVSQYSPNSPDMVLMRATKPLTGMTDAAFLGPSLFCPSATVNLTHLQVTVDRCEMKGVPEQTDVAVVDDTTAFGYVTPTYSTEPNNWDGVSAFVNRRWFNGEEQLVVLRSDGRIETSKLRINRPRLLEVRSLAGCPLSSYPHTFECPVDGSAKITVYGANFQLLPGDEPLPSNPSLMRQMFRVYFVFPDNPFMLQCRGRVEIISSTEMHCMSLPGYGREGTVWITSPPPSMYQLGLANNTYEEIPILSASATSLFDKIFAVSSKNPPRGPLQENWRSDGLLMKRPSPSVSFETLLQDYCPKGSNGLICSAHGDCDPYAGICRCHATNELGYWAGPTCEECDVRFNDSDACLQPCPVGITGVVCSGAICSHGRCLCGTNWSTTACDGWAGCAGVGGGTTCSGHGECDSERGICICHPHWNGDRGCATCTQGRGNVTCDTLCPEGMDFSNELSVCSGHGHCGIDSGGVCFCHPGWCGAECHLSGTACPATCSFPTLYGPQCDQWCPGIFPHGYEFQDVMSPCNGHGQCDSGTDGTGTCRCDEGFGLRDCSGACPSGAGGSICSGHGLCDSETATCRCNSTYAGVSCAQQCPFALGLPCSGHGVCADGATASGTCSCSGGWGGDDCSKSCGIGTICSGHGVCIGEGQCSCNNNNVFGYWTGAVCESCVSGYGGPSCTVPCPRSASGTLCFGHGYCNAASGTCICYSSDTLGFFAGANCTDCAPGYNDIGRCLQTCPGGCIPCSGHGACGQSKLGVCDCARSAESGYWDFEACHDCLAGYYGPECRQKCPDCMNGQCSDGTTGSGQCICLSGFTYGPQTLAEIANGTAQQCSVCAPGFFGPTCRSCPRDEILSPAACAGHGYCNDGLTGNGLCVCSLGYAGVSCNITCDVTNGYLCGIGGACKQHDPQPISGYIPREGYCLCSGNFQYGEYTKTCDRCLAGKWGLSCEYPCGECVFGSCNPVDGVCICLRGYWGPTCSDPCPGGYRNPCSGHGTCDITTGTCTCYANSTLGFYAGSQCDRCDSSYLSVGCTVPCPMDSTTQAVCSGRGICWNGICSLCTALPSEAATVEMVCGDSCQIVNNGTACRGGACPAGKWGPPACLNNCACASTGICNENTGLCECFSGYGGSTCSVACPRSNDGIPCSGQGYCSTAGTCECRHGYYGSACGSVCPGGAANPCNGRGTCSGISGTCTCINGAAGASCNDGCPGDIVSPCMYNGDCVSGVCVCYANSTHGYYSGDGCTRCAALFFGVQCSNYCPPSRGTVVGIECKCTPLYVGTTCQFNCPVSSFGEICSGHGTCELSRVNGIEQASFCTCDADFYGTDCSQYCTEDLCRQSLGLADAVQCNVNTGACECGAPGRYYGSDVCDICATGYWGDLCMYRCACNDHGSCDRLTGLCNCFTDSVNGFWTGRTCDVCVDGYLAGASACRQLNLPFRENVGSTRTFLETASASMDQVLPFYKSRRMYLDTTLGVVIALLPNTISAMTAQNAAGTSSALLTRRLATASSAAWRGTFVGMWNSSHIVLSMTPLNSFTPTMAFVRRQSGIAAALEDLNAIADQLQATSVTDPPEVARYERAVQQRRGRNEGIISASTPSGGDRQLLFSFAFRGGLCVLLSQYYTPSSSDPITMIRNASIPAVLSCPHLPMGNVDGDASVYELTSYGYELFFGLGSAITVVVDPVAEAWIAIVGSGSMCRDVACVRGEPSWTTTVLQVSAAGLIVSAQRLPIHSAQILLQCVAPSGKIVCLVVDEVASTLTSVLLSTSSWTIASRSVIENYAGTVQAMNVTATAIDGDRLCIFAYNLAGAARSTLLMLSCNTTFCSVKSSLDLPGTNDVRASSLVVDASMRLLLIGKEIAGTGTVEYTTMDLFALESIVPRLVDARGGAITYALGYGFLNDSSWEIYCRFGNSTETLGTVINDTAVRCISPRLPVEVDGTCETVSVSLRIGPRVTPLGIVGVVFVPPGVIRQVSVQYNQQTLIGYGPSGVPFSAILEGSYFVDAVSSGCDYVTYNTLTHDITVHAVSTFFRYTSDALVVCGFDSLPAIPLAPDIEETYIRFTADGTSYSPILTSGVFEIIGELVGLAIESVHSNSALPSTGDTQIPTFTVYRTDQYNKKGRLLQLDPTLVQCASISASQVTSNVPEVVTFSDSTVRAVRFSQGAAVFDNVHLVSPTTMTLSIYCFAISSLSVEVSTSFRIIAGPPAKIIVPKRGVWNAPVLTAGPFTFDPVAYLTDAAENTVVLKGSKIVLQTAMATKGLGQEPTRWIPVSAIGTLDDLGRYQFPAVTVRTVFSAPLFIDLGLSCDAACQAGANITLVRPDGRNVVPNTIVYVDPEPCAALQEYGVSDTFDCDSCPTGAQCDGSDSMVVLEGYWRVGASTTDIYPCSPPDACTGQSVCETGYIGAMCGSCDFDHGYARTGSSCARCASTTLNGILIALLLVGIVFFIFITASLEIRQEAIWPYVKPPVEARATSETAAMDFSSALSSTMPSGTIIKGSPFGSPVMSPTAKSVMTNKSVHMTGSPTQRIDVVLPATRFNPLPAMVKIFVSHFQILSMLPSGTFGYLPDWVTTFFKGTGGASSASVSLNFVTCVVGTTVVEILRTQLLMIPIVLVVISLVNFVYALFMKKKRTQAVYVMADEPPPLVLAPRALSIFASNRRQSVAANDCVIADLSQDNFSQAAAVAAAEFAASANNNARSNFFVNEGPPSMINGAVVEVLSDDAGSQRQNKYAGRRGPSGRLPLVKDATRRAKLAHENTKTRFHEVEMLRNQNDLLEDDVRMQMIDGEDVDLFDPKLVPLPPKARHVTSAIVTNQQVPHQNDKRQLSVLEITRQGEQSLFMELPSEAVEAPAAPAPTAAKKLYDYETMNWVVIRIWWIRATCVSIGVFFFLILPSVVDACVATLQCRAIPSLERTILMTDPIIDCNTSSYRTTNAVSWVVLLFMVFCGPLCLVGLVYAVAWSTCHRNVEHAKQIFSFMTSAYTPKLWFWDCSSYTLKSIVVLSVLLTAGDSSAAETASGDSTRLRCAICIWAIAIVLGLTLKLKPWRKTALHNVELVSYLGLLVSYGFAYLLFTPVLSVQDKAAVAILLVLVNFGGFIVYAWCIWDVLTEPLSPFEISQLGAIERYLRNLLRHFSNSRGQSQIALLSTQVRSLEDHLDDSFGFYVFMSELVDVCDLLMDRARAMDEAVLTRCVVRSESHLQNQKSGGGERPSFEGLSDASSCAAAAGSTSGVVSNPLAGRSSRMNQDNNSEGGGGGEFGGSESGYSAPPQDQPSTQALALGRSTTMISAPQGQLATSLLKPSSEDTTAKLLVGSGESQSTTGEAGGGGSSTQERPRVKSMKLTQQELRRRMVEAESAAKAFRAASRAFHETFVIARTNRKLDQIESNPTALAQAVQYRLMCEKLLEAVGFLLDLTEGDDL